jgi:hypothetical protein
VTVKIVYAGLILLVLLSGQLLADGCKNLRFNAGADADHYVESSEIPLTYFLLNESKQSVHVLSPDPLLQCGSTLIRVEIFNASSGEPVTYRTLLKFFPMLPGETAKDRVEFYQQLLPKQLMGMRSSFNTQQARLRPGVSGF